MDIADSRELLPALLDALADAVIVVDRDRRIVAANRLYLETFGDRNADPAGASCTEAVRCPEAPDRGHARCVACQVMDSGIAQRRLRQVPDATGVFRRFEATFSPILKPDGQASHVVEVWRDITDRSQIEVQLAHSERLASVGVLAAGVAHEINNPLASILAGVEGLARWLGRGRFGPDDVHEASETVEMLEREIERGRETTSKLMLLGRSFDATPSWVDLNQAVRDTLALLRFELRRHGVETVEALDPSLPHLWAREAGMRGVCMNLMINAVQAMSEGGTLSVATSHAGDRIQLTVADTGPGIAREHLARIWDPFFTTKPVGQGTGLGLSITNRIVTRHGGSITVQSSPGQGARFEVLLPVHGSGGGA